MAYMNSSINSSATIIDKAATNLENAGMLAMAYTVDGKLEIASAAGAPAIGIAISETGETVKKDDDVSVVVKDITHWRAGAAIAKGAEVMTGADGRAVPAAEGGFILGVALEAGAADAVIPVQIVKAGYKPEA